MADCWSYKVVCKKADEGLLLRPLWDNDIVPFRYNTPYAKLFFPGVRQDWKVAIRDVPEVTDMSPEGILDSCYFRWCVFNWVIWGETFFVWEIYFSI